MQIRGPKGQYQPLTNIDERSKQELAEIDHDLPWRRSLTQGNQSLDALEADLQAAMVVLTVKQRKFVMFITMGEPQTEAYTKAGYSAKNANVAGAGANRLLSKVKVSKALVLAEASFMLMHGISTRWKRQQVVNMMALCSTPGETFNPTGANKAMQLLMELDGDSRSGINGSSNSGINININTGVPSRDKDIIDVDIDDNP